MSEVDQFIDDMQAIRADFESGDPALQAHALGAMAAVMANVAKKCAAVPGLGRLRRMLLDQAGEALEHKLEMEAAIHRQEESSRRAHRALARWSNRHEREEKQRAERERKWLAAGQPDMFT